GEVRLEARPGRRKPEAAPGTAPEIAVVAAEVELDERAGRQPPRAVVGERGAQEARLEDGDRRPEPMARAQLDLVADVGVAVDVDELDGARQAVVAGGTEV